MLATTSRAGVPGGTSRTLPSGSVSRITGSVAPVEQRDDAPFVPEIQEQTGREHDGDDYPDRSAG